MTPDEFYNARKALGLTQKALAERLRMGRHAWQTMSRWEGGLVPIPGPVEIAMKHLLHCECGIARPAITSSTREGDSYAR